MKKLTTAWLQQLPLQELQTVTPVSGGDINEAYQLTTKSGARYFLKVQPGRGKAFFDHEVEGLNLIGQVATVPTVIASGEIETDGYLILQWIETGNGNQFELGKMVANVHQQQEQRFGLDHDFRLGRFPKVNQWQSNWATFFIQQRLQPLAQLAQQKGRWNQTRSAALTLIMQQLQAYAATHVIKPSLLHGDLWAGNALFNHQHQPLLIDPDVYYGDREFDLGITTVFGGFTAAFYSGYQSVYPCRPGVEARLPWYRFYYVLMHVVLFGESYGTYLDQISSNLLNEGRQ
ncbi:fructosamine kinase family protein [Fructilactobacillus myrtifloralis]|uniref:Fructosamine kinase family protein n=1 Tax=Fructilactobacillus myrtifloralis TaxID=2940301 RepID=A0ABY5BSR1_9LACO|nr:fructosamine kinase family protein [Fructilactobacillus myrtifloralis]USS85404.1 fructosamine kinase family protein [Fructilactobacillus myrtifloralis]